MISIIFMLLHESEAKLRMSVNNKDIMQMYLGYWKMTGGTLFNLMTSLLYITVQMIFVLLKITINRYVC